MNGREAGILERTEAKVDALDAKLDTLFHVLDALRTVVLGLNLERAAVTTESGVAATVAPPPAPAAQPPAAPDVLEAQLNAECAALEAANTNTYDDVVRIVVLFASAKGRPAAEDLLEKTAGVRACPALKPNQYDAVYRAFSEAA